MLQGGGNGILYEKGAQHHLSLKVLCTRGVKQGTATHVVKQTEVLLSQGQLLRLYHVRRVDISGIIFIAEVITDFYPLRVKFS